jgi:hypothetical protein
MEIVRVIVIGMGENIVIDASLLSCNRKKIHTANISGFVLTATTTF